MLRLFDEARVPSLDVIADCVAAGGTAPSGAHKQPWSYVIVQSADAKRQIRELVEREEAQNYATRMAQSWKDDLKSMMSNLHATEVNETEAITKAYLTEAPFLCCLFAQPYGVDSSGARSEATV